MKKYFILIMIHITSVRYKNIKKFINVIILLLASFFVFEIYIYFEEKNKALKRDALESAIKLQTVQEELKNLSLDFSNIRINWIMIKDSLEAERKMRYEAERKLAALNTNNRSAEKLITALTEENNLLKESVRYREQSAKAKAFMNPKNSEKIMLGELEYYSIEHQKTNNYNAILFLITMIIIWLFINLSDKKRLITRQYDSLNYKNENLQRQKEQISVQNEKIKAQQSELYHRVSNNLQSIMNFLINKYRFADATIWDIAKGFRLHLEKIHTIQGLIYMKDEDGNLQRTHTDRYIENLAREVMDLMLSANKPCEQIYEVEAYSFSLENMIAIGFIVNECVSNTCKYAFTSGNESPKLYISLKKQGDVYEMIVRDNGKKEVKELFREGSEGRNIIDTNVHQLYGKWSWKWDKGVEIRIVFSPQN